MKAMKKLMLACTLFAGTAFGQDNKEAPQKQDFTQLISASVYEPGHLPRSGTLEAGYVTLLQDALRFRPHFKMATWALCMAPTSYEDGTVLSIDSVQTLPRDDKGPRVVEVRYRPVKTAGNHATHKVWPYAVLMVKGLADEVVCRPAQG